MVDDLSKEDISQMLLDIGACPDGVDHFLGDYRTPKEYWRSGGPGCAWIVNSPANIDMEHLGLGAIRYSEAIEILVTEWLVITQCPDYWREWQGMGP
jgi:hypothetical protein